MAIDRCESASRRRRGSQIRHRFVQAPRQILRQPRRQAGLDGCRIDLRQAGHGTVRVSASDASSGGGTGAFSLRSSVGLSNELYERVQRPVRSAYSTQKVRADPACLTSRSASQPAETIKKDRGRVRGGLPGRRRRARAATCGYTPSFAPGQGSQNRPRRSCGDLIHALGKPRIGATSRGALEASKASLWFRECLAQTALRSGSGCFNVVAAVRAAQQGCQPQTSKARA